MDILELVSSVPNNREGNVFAKQIVRSSTSTGANYRAACKAKYTADMINKLKIVEEELDESMYWLELIQVRFSNIKIDILHKEANELLSIIVASVLTLKRKIRNS